MPKKKVYEQWQLVAKRRQDVAGKRWGIEFYDKDSGTKAWVGEAYENAPPAKKARLKLVGKPIPQDLVEEMIENAREKELNEY